MFKRISSYFRNLKVSRKLAYGFGAVVFLALLVGAVSLVAGQLQAAAVSNLQEERDQSASLRLIVETTNEAEVDEHIFEEEWRTNGYDQMYQDHLLAAKSYTSDALGAVNQAIKLSGTDQEEIDKLGIIKTALEKYDTLLDKNAALLKAQGELDTGLEGEMRAAAHDIEAAIGLDPDNQVASFATSTYDPKVLAAYLSMRRNEKDFQLRLDPKYAKATRDFNTVLQNSINASEDISPSQQASMISQAKNYITVFDQQVQNYTDAASTKVDLETTVDSFDPTLEELLTDQAAQEAQALQNYETASATETAAQIVFVVLALLTSVLVAVAISRSISSQVDEINHLFRAAAIGNFDVRARVLSNDELGLTAQGVNAMLEQLTSFIGAAAKAAQQRFSDVVTTMADWVWEIDPDGKYSYISDPIFEASGYTPQELLGHNAVEYVLPEDRDRVGAELQKAALDKTQIADLEVHSIRKDGSAAILQISAIPVLDEHGNVQGLRGTGKDITQSKEAERQIRENEAQLRGIFDNLQDGFYRSDAQGRMVMASPSAARLLGYSSPDEMIGLNISQQMYVHAEDREVMLDQLGQTGKVTDYEVEVYRKDRSTVFMGISSTYYHDADGNIVGVEGTFRDLTQRRQAEDQIEEQNKALARTLDELRGLMVGVETAAGQVTGASGSLQAIVELIAGQAATSAEMAARATGSAQEGDSAVSNTMSAMGRIRETTQETARRIKKLGEVSQEIGEVVRLIDEIADRVTVLALNASIQAAAAGDAGRGFAVVAEEVQRLAERATGATRQIENLIKGVQGEINEAMVSVEEVTQEVVGGSQLAQEAGQRMTDLSDVVSDLARLIQHLSQTTSMQTAQSLDTLTALAENLRSSVAALRMPEEEAGNGNGYGNGAQTTLTM